MDVHAQTYCLYCLPGNEESVMDDLRMLGYAPMAPQYQKVYARHAERPDVIMRVLPGYVFFDAPGTPLWKTVRSIPHVVRILGYGEEEAPLRGDDLEFVRCLKSHDGLISASSAVREGTRLKFVSGPLKELSGRIVAVNTKRQAAAVAFGGDGAIGKKVWCSFDYA